MWITMQAFIDHVRTQNPLGRGRPYSIAELVQLREQLPSRPKRLT